MTTGCSNQSTRKPTDVYSCVMRTLSTLPTYNKSHNKCLRL